MVINNPLFDNDIFFYIIKKILYNHSIFKSCHPGLVQVYEDIWEPYPVRIGGLNIPLWWIDSIIGNFLLALIIAADEPISHVTGTCR